MDERPSLRERIEEVRRKLPLEDVIGEHVKLSGSAGARNRRGKCPFHNGNSPSFSVKDGSQPHGKARCFGCQWSGHVVDFVRDTLGLSFIDALKECEARAGIIQGGCTVRGSGPVVRRRDPAPRRQKEFEPVEPVEMGRALWRKAWRDPVAVRRYFLGRGVPAAVLTDARLAPFRYLAECPCTLWQAGQDWARKGAPIAPAIMALVKVPQILELEGGSRLEFVPVALHVTWLNPGGDGTMVRRKPWAKPDDPDPMLPKRKMLGPVGRGCIVLGDYSPGAHLWVGEGNETVLSAMGIAEVDESAVGIATLSLDNLQGRVKRWNGGVLPLFAIDPDPDHPPFGIPGHRGPVTGLIDSDMSPLKGIRNRKTGEFEGEPMVERRGGPIVRRAISGAERARICAELVVKGWRAIGSHPVDALRAPLGMDFNDAARALAEESGEAVAA